MRIGESYSSTGKVCKVLKRARALIRKGWTQRAYARTKSNKPVDAANRYADKFCSIGAIQKAAALCDATSFESNAAEDALRRAIEAMTRSHSGVVSWNVVSWNDRADRTKQQVLDVFGIAIKKVCR